MHQVNSSERAAVISRKTGWQSTRAALIVSMGLLCAGAESARASVNIAFGDFQGAWAATASYTTGAVITYGGASYIALGVGAPIRAIAPTEGLAVSRVTATAPTGPDESL